MNQKTNLLAYIKQNPFFLAPMAGVTDKPFRSFMKEMGCGIITSELASARALKDNNFRTRQLVDFSGDQKPFGIQIFGEDPEMMAEGAKRAEGMGADFIDLNLGCPVRKIVKKGAGSALLKDLKTLTQVLQALRGAVQIPLSLKVRTGWDEQSRNANQVAHIAYEEGFSWMSIHGRTRSQGYSGHADWAYIREIKSSALLPIIGNGDIKSGVQAVSVLKQSACDGVMIGRGCLNDPWIFIEALGLLKAQQKPVTCSSAVTSKPCILKEQHFKNPSPNLSLTFKKDFKVVLNKLKTHLEDFYDERMFLIQMKKFAAWFSSGFPHSTEFRKTIFQEKDQKALFEKINCFFTSVQKEPPFRPKTYEPFLMQGHG